MCIRDSVRPNQEVLENMDKPQDFGFLILNIFPFTSDKKRMGTIVMDSNHASFPENEDSIHDSREIQEEKDSSNVKYHYVCKGAPEKMMELCKKDSIPSNYLSILDEYAQNGMRVISFAYKTLESPNLRQEDAEKNMIFGGFLLLSNPMKEGTMTTMKNLKFNHINCNMITGDHIFTGINVGYASGILSETESLWVGQFIPEKRKVDWKFYTYEDLKKNVHSVKENQDVDLNSKIFDQSRQTSAKRIQTPESSQKSLKFLGNIKSQLAAYSKIISVRNTTNIVKILKEQSDIDFQLALDGNAMQYLFTKYDTNTPEAIFLLKNTKIFGRCKPDQKRLIIEKLKEMKIKKHKCVAFVGDGANDCKALNHADIGLSIGNNEASMASPFITSDEGIQKLSDILELGRFTIENFVQVYLSLNGLGVMDVSALLILLFSGYYYTNFKYLIEYWYYCPMALIITSTSSIGSLKKVLPQALMFNKRVNFFLLGISSIIVLALGFGYWIYSSQDFFKYFEEMYHSNVINMEHHFVLDHGLLLIFYTFCVVAYSAAVQVGYPFKKPFYTNILYMILIVFLMVITIFFSHPSIFTSNQSVIYFGVHYLRACDYQQNFFMIWLFYCFISCCAIFFVGRYILEYFLQQKLVKIDNKENLILKQRDITTLDIKSSQGLYKKQNMSKSYLSKQSRKTNEINDGFSSKIHYDGQSAHDIY